MTTGTWSDGLSQRASACRSCAGPAGRRRAARAAGGRCGCRCSSARRRPDSPRKCSPAPVTGAEGVGQAEIEEPPEGRRGDSGWNSASSIQASGIARVIGLGDDVEVAGEHEGSSLASRRPAWASAAPSSRACRRICRCRSDCRWADRARRRGSRRPDREHRLDEARLGIVLVARQARDDLVEAALRQDRDAVKALLAVGLDVVAELLERLARERLRPRFDLLEAEHVRASRP